MDVGYSPVDGQDEITDRVQELRRALEDGTPGGCSFGPPAKSGGARDRERGIGAIGYAKCLKRCFGRIGTTKKDVNPRF